VQQARRLRIDLRNPHERPSGIPIEGKNRATIRLRRSMRWDSICSLKPGVDGPAASKCGIGEGDLAGKGVYARMPLPPRPTLIAPLTAFLSSGASIRSVPRPPTSLA
jgi:hypothetical protein